MQYDRQYMFTVTPTSRLFHQLDESATVQNVYNKQV